MAAAMYHFTNLDVLSSWPIASVKRCTHLQQLLHDLGRHLPLIQLPKQGADTPAVVFHLTLLGCVSRQKGDTWLFTTASGH